MQMQVLQWNKVVSDGLPKYPGSYLCCYRVNGCEKLLYNVFEFNKDAKEFQFGYVGVVVSHWAEIPKVKMFDAMSDEVSQEEAPDAE